MLKAKTRPDKQSSVEPQYSGSGRLIVPPTCLNPNMLAASKSKYDYQEVVIKPEAEKSFSVSTNRKINSTEKKSYPLEAADYIEIYWAADKIWYPATILQMLSTSKIYVCYDDGSFSTEKINTIEFRHISKQPAVDDLTFVDNDHRYFIPKGSSTVIKDRILEAAEQDSSNDHINDIGCTDKRIKLSAQEEHEEDEEFDMEMPGEKFLTYGQQKLNVVVASEMVQRNQNPHGMSLLIASVGSTPHTYMLDYQLALAAAQSLINISNDNRNLSAPEHNIKFQQS